VRLELRLLLVPLPPYVLPAFLPQIVKLRKQGGEDLSYSMLAVYLAGVLLWMIYGLLFHAAAVIWANVITFILVATSLILKANLEGSSS